MSIPIIVQPLGAEITQSDHERFETSGPFAECNVSHLFSMYFFLYCVIGVLAKGPNGFDIIFKSSSLITLFCFKNLKFMRNHSLPPNILSFSAFVSNFPGMKTVVVAALIICLNES